MGGPSPVRSGAEVEAFRLALRSVSRRNEIYFRIAMAILCILFVGSLFLVWRFIDQPAAVSGVFAATGVSFVWVFTQALSAWKEKVNSDLMLAVAAALPPDELRRLALALVEQKSGKLAAQAGHGS